MLFLFYCGKRIVFSPGERSTNYLDLYHKEKGYMLSFNFNKRKKTGVREIRVGNKVIVEAVV